MNCIIYFRELFKTISLGCAASLTLMWIKEPYKMLYTAANCLKASANRNVEFGQAKIQRAQVSLDNGTVRRGPIPRHQPLALRMAVMRTALVQYICVPLMTVRGDSHIWVSVILNACLSIATAALCRSSPASMIGLMTHSVVQVMESQFLQHLAL